MTCESKSIAGLIVTSRNVVGIEPPLGIFFLKIIYLFLTVLGLCSCGQVSLVAASTGYSLVVVFRLLTAMAVLVGEHRLALGAGAQ